MKFYIRHNQLESGASHILSDLVSKKNKNVLKKPIASVIES